MKPITGGCWATEKESAQMAVAESWERRILIDHIVKELRAIELAKQDGARRRRLRLRLKREAR